MVTVSHWRRVRTYYPSPETHQKGIGMELASTLNFFTKSHTVIQKQAKEAIDRLLSGSPDTMKRIIGVVKWGDMVLKAYWKA